MRLKRVRIVPLASQWPPDLQAAARPDKRALDLTSQLGDHALETLALQTSQVRVELAVGGVSGPPRDQRSIISRSR